MVVHAVAEVRLLAVPGARVGAAFEGRGPAGEWVRGAWVDRVALVVALETWIEKLEMATLLLMEMCCAVGLFVVMDVVRGLGCGAFSMG